MRKFKQIESLNSYQNTFIQLEGISLNRDHKIKHLLRDHILQTLWNFLTLQ